jgi:putative SOS response-associated peptidase YedK
MPASHLYKFMGSKSFKAKFKFTIANEPRFCFAGLWRPGQGVVEESSTLLTTARGPDVAPIHSRQMVVLRRQGWRAWLDLTAPEAVLLKPLPAGSLLVEQVR